MVQISLLEKVYCGADADDDSVVWMIFIMCVCGTQQASSRDGLKKDTLG